MISLSIPKILFNTWLWIALMAIVIVIRFFYGKTPPSPQQSKFFTKHKKTINKISDICIVCLVLVFCLLLVYVLVIPIIDTLSFPQKIRAIDICFACAPSLILAIPTSGLSGVVIGFLSVFHSNLTKRKRVILLIICLLPLAFTILVFTVTVLLTGDIEEPWLLIKLGLIYSLLCWIINGPAIIIGKHFLPVWWNIMCKLRLVSGDYPG